MTLKRKFGQILEQATEAPVSIQTSWQFEDEGYFLYSDPTVQGSAQHDLTHRGPYEDPETGPDMGGGNFIGSPWSFTQEDQLGIQLYFEDDNTCHPDAPNNDDSAANGVLGNVMPTTGDWQPMDHNGVQRDHYGAFNNNQENDPDNINDPDFGPPQEGQATLIVEANRDTTIQFHFSGMGERAYPTDSDDWSTKEPESPLGSPGIFEEMRLYAEDITDNPSNPPGDKDDKSDDEDWIGWARAPGGSKDEDSDFPADCRAGMDPIVTHEGTIGGGVYPETYALTSGRTYRFRVYCSTRDSWYHVGAHYQFTVTFT